MRITDWPIAERPRERLLNLGPAALSNTELLAIFLRTGMPGKTALDMARDLLNNFGNLKTLLEAQHDEFCSHPGLGSAKYAQLQAALELGKRYFYESMEKEEKFLPSSHATKQYLISKLSHYKYEVFVCLFLDTKNRILAVEEMFRGTLNTTNIYPRQVVQRALALNAGSVLLSHNHPSGDPEPSLEDKKVTQQLINTLGLFEIKVLDHIVVGKKHAVSFAERGLLQPFNKDKNVI